MKYILLLLFPFQLFAQTYSAVENVDSLSKDKLFSLAASWFATYYKSAQNVIQLSDKEDGKIIGKAVYPYRLAVMGNKQSYVNYTITVMVKDGKYKIEMADFNHEGGAYGKGYSGGLLSNEKPDCGNLFITKKMWSKIQEKGKSESETAIANFKTFIASESKKEDF